jgi:serine/threonine protein phosphatase PrpC
MHVQSDTPSAPVSVPDAEGGPLELQAVARSDMGRKRRNNEDNCLVFDLSRGLAHSDGTSIRVEIEPPGFLLVVADGMGGHQSGEVASRLAVETLSKELVRALSERPGDASETRLALSESVERTNKAIYEVAAQKPEYQGMGTTLTAALVSGRSVLVAQVGDSRAYLCRGDSLTQLTKDQTVKASVLELQPDAVINENLGNMLAQALGTEPEVKVAITAAELQQGDVLLLCSDGLTKTVPNDQVVNIARHGGTLRAKAETLIALANQAGGPDNVTVVLSAVGRKED